MSDLTPMQSFQEKIKDRIKENIMDSLPDEVVDSLFDKCLNETFFKGKENKNNWGQVTSIQKSWFEEEVLKLCKPILEERLKIWFKDHEDIAKKAMDKVLDTNMLSMLATKIMMDSYYTEMNNRVFDIQNQLSNLNVN